MKMRKSTVLILSSVLISTVSCLKQQNQADAFPAETQEGKNTIGCYIDGTPFIAATTLFGAVLPVSVTFYKDTIQYPHKAGFLSIGGTDARYTLDVAGHLSLNKVNVFAMGNYPLTNQNLICIERRECDGIAYYNSKTGRTYFAESGKFTLTRLDTINKIVSGRFYFTAKDSLGNRIQITDGRFDAKYRN